VLQRSQALLTCRRDIGIIITDALDQHQWLVLKVKQLADFK